MTMLTNEDKIGIINQQKRNLEYGKYALEVSVIVENAVASPDETALSSLNEKIADFNLKLAALDAAIAAL